MACHVTKLNNINKLPTIQKLIILVNSNLKVFQTVYCTCTILSISDKSRFTSTHIWSTCIITRSLLVASARACAAFINIYRKIRKKEIKNMNKISAKDISILVSIKEPWDPGSTQKPQFLWSCLLQVLLWWNLSIKVLFLNSPCSYSVKHTTYELLLYALNLPVQFCPFPVYPGWQ